MRSAMGLRPMTHLLFLDATTARIHATKLCRIKTDQLTSGTASPKYSTTFDILFTAVVTADIFLFVAEWLAC